MFAKSTSQAVALNVKLRGFQSRSVGMLAVVLSSAPHQIRNMIISLVTIYMIHFRQTIRVFQESFCYKTMNSKITLLWCIEGNIQIPFSIIQRLQKFRSLVGVYTAIVKDKIITIDRMLLDCNHTVSIPQRR